MRLYRLDAVAESRSVHARIAVAVGVLGFLAQLTHAQARMDRNSSHPFPNHC